MPHRDVLNNPTLKKIHDVGIVLVVRAEKADETLFKALEAIAAGGVKAIEITFSVPDAVSVIRQVKERSARARPTWSRRTRTSR